MKKNNKQEEFIKMLDLGKEDISNLSKEAMTNINGGYTVPKYTNDTQCQETIVLGCDSYGCATAGCTYSCVCANTRICA